MFSSIWNIQCSQSWLIFSSSNVYSNVSFWGRPIMTNTLKIAAFPNILSPEYFLFFPKHLSSNTKELTYFSCLPASLHLLTKIYAPQRWGFWSVLFIDYLRHISSKILVENKWPHSNTQTLKTHFNTSKGLFYQYHKGSLFHSTKVMLHRAKGKSPHLEQSPLTFSSCLTHSLNRFKSQRASTQNKALTSSSASPETEPATTCYPQYFIPISKYLRLVTFKHASHPSKLQSLNEERQPDLSALILFSATNDPTLHIPPI